MAEEPWPWDTGPHPDFQAKGELWPGGDRDCPLRSISADQQILLAPKIWSTVVGWCLMLSSAALHGLRTPVRQHTLISV
jgi:hypothetical protein